MNLKCGRNINRANGFRKIALAVILVLRVVGWAHKEIGQAERGVGDPSESQRPEEQPRSHPLYTKVPPRSYYPQPLSATSINMNCGPLSKFTAKIISKDAIKPKLHCFCEEDEHIFYINVVNVENGCFAGTSPKAT